MNEAHRFIQIISGACLVLLMAGVLVKACLEGMR